MTDTSDVVVVGGGHNALAAAAYLARAGLSVTVLEERDVPGGGVATEELTLPGFRHDTCSSYHVDIQFNPLLAADELGLRADYGLRYEFPDPVMVVQTPDGPITQPRGVDAMASMIAEYSEHDAEAYRQMNAEFDELIGTYVHRLSGPPGTIGDASPTKGARLNQLLASSGFDFIAERFEDERARHLILLPAMVLPLEFPGTGFYPMYFAATTSRLSWPHAIGGSGALVNALTSFITAHGGRVLCERLVERIVVEGGRAAAVLTADGERFDAARAVVSSAHSMDLAALLGPGHLPNELETLKDRWVPDHSALAVHLALSQTPTYRTQAGPQVASTGLFGRKEAIAAQQQDVMAGRWPGAEGWMMVMCPTIVDPSRAPDGKTILKLVTPAPYALDNDPANWEQAKEACGDELVRVFADAVDGYSPGDELARAVFTPADLVRINRHNRGGLQGGDLIPEQFGTNRPAPGWSAYRMPVPSLYQTGGSTYPLGGVTGWPGRNAARAVLDDLGIDAKSFMQEVGEPEALPKELAGVSH